jgi:uncharacterized protein (TIGR02246 family)
MGGLPGVCAMTKLLAAVVAIALTGVVAPPPPVQARTPAPPAQPVVCHRISDSQVAALFDRWNKALATRNPDTVIANYAADATLLPTVQNGPLIGRPDIRGYFVYFLKQSPQGAIDQRVIHVGCNIAYDIGLYTFTLSGDQPGSSKQVKARYTFVYALDHGTWLIVHHHSSALPVPGP